MMVETVSGLRRHISIPMDQLLMPGERVYIVDDDPAIREPLKIFLEDQGLPVGESGKAEDFLKELQSNKIALALLDIGLPDIDGRTLLPQIAESHPDLSVVMLTGVADLKIAMECIREGADDYLSKPVKFDEILFVVKKALEKRRLILENRKYHEELEKANFRINVLHQLAVKMNTAYLTTVELDDILKAILVGITANEGLRFNRAFLVMFDDDHQFLRGRMAIGPGNHDEAGQIWAEMDSSSMGLMEIVHNLGKDQKDEDNEVNRIARSLIVSIDDRRNILIKAAMERRSIKIERENGCVPVAMERRIPRGAGGESTWPEVAERREKDNEDPLSVPADLIELLKIDEFIVVPLFSPGRSFGVIIADNFVTGQAISDSHINSLELFASQASLAIEHSFLYRDQEKKIGELEELTNELENSKNLLVEAERFSTLGQMSAQLVHSIRNPITSIGGMARILARKSATDEQKRFLEVIGKETSRLDKVLDDLNNFTEQFKEIERQPVPLCDMLRKTLLLVQPEMDRYKISYQLECSETIEKIEINGDLKNLRQMFLHLFKNAIEAMPNGGKLEVEVERIDDKISVAIRDTGEGMPEDSLEKARDPFFTTKTYGTGMGLAMVDNVVKTHGGSFEMMKRETGGLQVLVHFPTSLLIKKDH